MREYIGQATVTDSSKPDLPADSDGVVTEYVNVNGLFQHEAAVLGFKDEQAWEFYGGVIYNLAEAQPLGTVAYNGTPYYSHLYVLTEASQIYKGYDNMLIGGYVAEGYLAITNSGLYSGITCNGLFMRLFSDEAYATPVANFAAYTDILLVDPAKDNNGLAPAAPATAAKMAQLDGLKKEIRETPMNYVQTERGRIRSIIDKYNSTPRNYAGNVAGLENAERDVRAVEFTVDSAEPFKVEKKFEYADMLF